MHTIVYRRWRPAYTRLATLILASLLLGQSAVAQPAAGKRLDDKVTRGELRVGSMGDNRAYFSSELEPLRRAIDQRLLLAQAVARAKWTTQAPIEDLPREALVIEAAVHQGAALALPRAWIEDVFRAQIEASKTVQRELYASWKAQPPSPLEAVPNLAATIRPELDRLTTQILTAMANQRELLRDPARQADVARTMLTLEAASLNPAAASQALAPFLTSRSPDNGP